MSPDLPFPTRTNILGDAQQRAGMEDDNELQESPDAKIKHHKVKIPEIYCRTCDYWFERFLGGLRRYVSIY